MPQLLLDHEPVISCGTLIETLRVMQVGLGAPALRAIDRLIELYGVKSVPVDAEQVALAREGMLAYGKGRGAVPAVLELRRSVRLRAGQTAAPAAAAQGRGFRRDRRRARAVNRQSGRGHA